MLHRIPALNFNFIPVQGARHAAQSGGNVADRRQVRARARGDCRQQRPLVTAELQGMRRCAAAQMGVKCRQPDLGDNARSHDHGCAGMRARCVGPHARLILRHLAAKHVVQRRCGGVEGSSRQQQLLVGEAATDAGLQGRDHVDARVLAKQLFFDFLSERLHSL